MIALPLLAALAVMPAPVATDPTVTESRWTLHGQLQLPVMAANHVVGGIGFGTEVQRGLLALGAEAQILFVTICDDYASCGPAYEGGIGASAMPGQWGDVTSHLSLLAEYFVHPGLHQSFLGLSPRAGLRWLSGGTGFSLDAALTLASADNFATNGFAWNKVLSWAMPELLLGIWF
jgi:hypothetical protein